MRIFLFFILLLMIGATIFVVTSDFAACAKIPVGVPTKDITGMGEEIAEVQDRIPAKINFLFYTTTALLVLLTIASLFLNWAAGIGMYLGDGSLGHVFYDIGYTWVLGMVNMFFVIVFVFAALLYILDVEWGIVDKKTILKLIIVALLINFSSLFVKIIVDFFIIFERGVLETLLPGGLRVPLRAIKIQASLNWFILVLVPYLIVFKLPHLIATIKGFFTFGVTSFLLRIKQLILLPTLVAPFFMEAISNLLLSIVFFTYAALFIARSVVIYVFLMLAPLAMVCIIFPKTRQYFNEWLKQLFLWGAMGTVIFFVLSFGFRMRELIADRFNWELIEGFGIGVGGIMIFVANLFFAIYAIISLFMIKRFLPSAAQGIVGMVQKGAALAAVAGGGMIAGAALMKYGGRIEQTIGRGAKALGIKDESLMGGVVEDFREKIRDSVKKRRDKRTAQYEREDLTPEERIKIAERLSKDPKNNEQELKALFQAMVNQGDKIENKTVAAFGCTRKIKTINSATGEEEISHELDLNKFEKLVGGSKKLKSDCEHMAHLKDIQSSEDKIRYKELKYEEKSLSPTEREEFETLKTTMSDKDMASAEATDINTLTKEMDDTYAKIMRTASDSVLKNVVKGVSSDGQEIIRQLALKDGTQNQTRAACLDDKDILKENCQKVMLGDFRGEKISKNSSSIVERLKTGFSEDSLKILCTESGKEIDFDLINKIRTGEIKDQAKINDLMKQLERWAPK